jgi:CTP:molybdopterin cytidylyltransferase MocA
MNKGSIVPIILAAGSSERLEFAKALARFGKKTALEIAVENCAGLARPIVVLGSDAAVVRSRVPRGARIVINQRWRKGQLNSLLAGLRHVPKDAAFMIYPVDHPLLTKDIVRLLVREFYARLATQAIVMPKYKRRPGHPIICAPEIRLELARAATARDVVYKEPTRIRYVLVGSRGVYLDFATPEAYLQRLQELGLRSVMRKRRR